MKKFNVIVNGTSYDVTIQELKEGETVAPVTQKQETTVHTTPAPSSNGVKVTSPMPGNMWKVLVKQGQSVKEGDVLVILEAMKMENEIMSPCDGVITSLNVSEGATVDTDALICVIG